MNVRQVAVQVGIRDEQVIGKAQELVRLSSVKIPGGLGPGEVCKAAACLELACSTSSHVVPPGRDVFVRQGCVTKKVYMGAYLLLQKALGAGPAAPTVAELALQHGCESLARPAEILLALYRKRFLARLNAAPSAAAAPSTSASAGPGSASAATASGHTGPAPGQQQGAGGAQADFSRPAFAVAALQLTAAKAGGGKGKAHKLDVRKVLQQLGIPAAHYQSVCDSIKELCAAELGLDAAPAPSTSAGAGGEQQGEGAPADAASGVAAEGAAQQPPRKGRKRVAEGDAGRGEGGGGAAGRGGKRRGRKARAGSGGEGEGLDGEGLGGLEGEAVGEEAEEAWEVLGRAGEQERGGAKRSRRSGR